MAPGMPGRGGAALLCLSALLAHASSRSHPASPSPPGPQASPVLPVSYRLSHTRLAFFLRETRPPTTTPAVANGSLHRSEPFVVFQTKELPVLNVTLGPFSTSQVVAQELLQPSSTLDIPERLTVNWKVRAFMVRARVPASQPVAQVLFYVAGRDWDDFGVSERLPCVRLHAFRDAREHPLLRIGSISLYRPPPRRDVQEHRLDSNLMIRLPDRPLKPGEVLSILLYLAPNTSSATSPSVEHFTLRVKAKKGVTLLGTKSRSGQWHVTSELLTGAKHSTATVDVAWAQSTPLPPWEGQGPLEILQLDFEMENFTSQSVKRRIMWHIDYRGHGALPDLERAVTELTVIQRDVQAILPLAMDTEIINTAILTGRTVAIPVKVLAIEVTGLILDVSALVECKSDNEDIIKVSRSCDYVFVSGKESRGSMNARVTFRYDLLSAALEMTVWVPKLPLHIELSDARLSQVKGWRVPILPDRRYSTRESEDEDEEEEERRQSASRGCTLQYQHATLQVFTQFHTTSSEGTDQVVTMLGPDWLVEVTDLVSDFMRVGDPRVAHLVDSSTLAGLEPGTTPFKVVSPLTEAVLGETLLTVTEEKVSITQLRAQVVASLALALRPSPGSSHTILATTTAQPTLSFLKQEALLSLWLSYSDGTTAPLSLYSPRDYGLLVSSLDERVATVTQDKAFPLVMAEAEGSGELLRAELTISEGCQKTKRKSVLATTPVSLRVHLGRDEEDPTYDYPGPSQPGPAGGEDEARGAGPPGTAFTGSGAGPGTTGPVVPPTEDFLPLPTGFLQMPRGLTDLEIGMYALLGVFCLAILVFLINCIVFVLRYRHKRIPPEGQTSMDHSHHWVFLGNGQPLRVQGELSPPAGNALETVPACCHGDHHSSGSSQTSVQSQVHGRGDGSSGGSARDQAEDPASSPTSKRKRVKFTTFTTLPSEELAYDSVPAGEEDEEEEEDLGWGCPDVAGTTRPTPPPELHNYMRRIKEIA
uniref:Transmembrane protein 132E n=1 Tax=Jaculus jaculus TaxID=51337 RepID=A0A8C5L0L6_JACJA